VTGSDAGAGLPTRRFYYVLVLLRGVTQDGRLSSQLSRDNARRAARRRRQVNDEGEGKSTMKVKASQRRSLKVTHTLLLREARWESLNGYKGIALRQVFERIALRSGQGVWGKRPTRLLTEIKTRSQD